MTTALMESPENDQMGPSLSLDPVGTGQGTAPEMEAVVLDVNLPVRSTAPLHRDVLPKHRRGSLVARWVPDPLGESRLICIWVAQTGTEASESFDA